MMHIGVSGKMTNLKATSLWCSLVEVTLLDTEAAIDFLVSEPSSWHKSGALWPGLLL
jgi:hypothetical protein